MRAILLKVHHTTAHLILSGQQTILLLREKWEGEKPDKILLYTERARAVVGEVKIYTADWMAYEDLPKIADRANFWDPLGVYSQVYSSVWAVRLVHPVRYKPPRSLKDFGCQEIPYPFCYVEGENEKEKVDGTFAGV